MLNIMTRQQFEESYDQALEMATRVQEKEKETSEENQQARIEEQMGRVLNDWLLNPYSHQNATLKCPIILEKKMDPSFKEELKKMGWKVQSNGYDKYEGGYSYTVMKRQNVLNN